MIEILSVKNDVSNGDTYCIKYIETLKDGYKRVMTMDSPEPARPEFDMALAHMAQDFCDLAMLVPEETKSGLDPMERVKICTVAVNHGKKSTKYSLTAKIFNPTTCKYQSVSLPAIEDASITQDIMEDIYHLFAEAERYVLGERAQTKLTFADEQKAVS